MILKKENINKITASTKKHYWQFFVFLAVLILLYFVFWLFFHEDKNKSEEISIKEKNQSGN